MTNFILLILIFISYTPLNGSYDKSIVDNTVDGNPLYKLFRAQQDPKGIVYYPEVDDIFKNYVSPADEACIQAESILEISTRRNSGDSIYIPQKTDETPADEIHQQAEQIMIANEKKSNNQQNLHAFINALTLYKRAMIKYFEANAQLLINETKLKAAQSSDYQYGLGYGHSVRKIFSTLLNTKGTIATFRISNREKKDHGTHQIKPHFKAMLKIISPVLSHTYARLSEEILYNPHINTQEAIATLEKAKNIVDEEFIKIYSSLATFYLENGSPELAEIVVNEKLPIDNIKEKLFFENENQKEYCLVKKKLDKATRIEKLILFNQRLLETSPQILSHIEDGDAISHFSFKKRLEELSIMAGKSDLCIANSLNDFISQQFDKTEPQSSYNIDEVQKGFVQLYADLMMIYKKEKKDRSKLEIPIKALQLRIFPTKVSNYSETIVDQVLQIKKGVLDYKNLKAKFKKLLSFSGKINPLLKLEINKVYDQFNSLSITKTSFKPSQI